MAAQRDPARFDALYRKYLAQVYSFAFYELGDHHAAEDATERTFLGALGRLPQFREQAVNAGPDASTFRIWLFQIARNAIAMERRTRRRHPEVALETAGSALDPLDVESAVTRHDEATRAMRAIAGLPTERRRAVILRFVEEMSPAEIGAILGRSEGAVRVLIHRALRSVARDLGRDAS
jgi:RNA polymerase sigma-70 factor (ECF subfamily)